MQQRESMIQHEPETVIAASVKVEGDFVSQGNVVIDGSVDGSLKTERDLRVGERAHIAANVVAANAIIAGEVKGNITVSDRLELESTAKVHGDIRTKVLVVASGALMNGRIAMGQDFEPEQPRKLTREEILERARAARMAKRQIAAEEVVVKDEVTGEELVAEPAPVSEEPAPRRRRTLNTFFTG